MAHIDRLSAHQRAEMMAFSRRLTEQMARAGMSNSDLARAIWGTTMEGSKTVARNRDRISLYVNARQMPEPETIDKLAGALGCGADDLVPNTTATPRRAGGPVSLTLIGGRPDLALLTVNQILPTRLAARIASLIAAEPEVEMAPEQTTAPSPSSRPAKGSSVTPAMVAAALAPEDKAALQAARRATVAAQRPLPNAPRSGRPRKTAAKTAQAAAAR